MNYIILVILAIVAYSIRGSLHAEDGWNPDLSPWLAVFSFVFLVCSQVVLYRAGQDSRRPEIKRGMHGKVLAVHGSGRQGHMWYTIQWTVTGVIAVYELPNELGLAAGDNIIGYDDKVQKV
jgi:hypothetical protein